MTSPLRPFSEEIRRRRSALLKDYNEEDLHQLRVNIRRLRVFLAHCAGDETLDLRRQWGRLMRYTNSARDWDTCINVAGASLPTSAFDSLYPAMSQRQEDARALALQAVRSADWEAHVARWYKFLDTAPDFSTADYETALAAARTRIGTAWSEAGNNDDRRSWHKLRIAIKGLRYLVDSNPEFQIRHEELISLCKELQTDLGNWHDTVVHGRLLEELIVSGDVDNSTLAATDRLASMQAESCAACLASARSTLAERASLLELAG